MISLEDLLWQQAEPDLYITKEEFLKSLEGWEIKPIEIDGEVAIITLQKGPEFHFRSMGLKKPVSMKLIKATLGKVIDQWGYAETKTPKDDIRQHRFNRLIGFRQVGEDEFDTHFRIQRLPHD